MRFLIDELRAHSNELEFAMVNGLSGSPIMEFAGVSSASAVQRIAQRYIEPQLLANFGSLKPYHSFWREF